MHSCLAEYINNAQRRNFQGPLLWNHLTSSNVSIYTDNPSVTTKSAITFIKKKKKKSKQGAEGLEKKEEKD